ncbi:MAG: hypothetical protein WCS37_22460 [Chloroflexota bacterium]
MDTQQLTLNIPTYLYERLKRLADQTGRTVEDELLEAATSVASEDSLAPELEGELAQMAYLDEPSLWRAAQSHLPKNDAKRLEELHLKKQREGLTNREAQTAKTLVRRYERFMLVRAQAATLLKQRGQDISKLVQPY